MYIKPFTPTPRRREFNQRTPIERALCLYHWTFSGNTHREIDEIVFNLNPKESKGYASMGVLHALGLKKEHRECFKNTSIKEVIRHLERENFETSEVIEYLTILERNPNIISLKQQQYSLSQELLLEENIISSVNLVNKQIQISDLSEEYQLSDGELHSRLQTIHERNPLNRLAAINFNGTTCKACNFNFEDKYGEQGKNFIEIHHIEPLFQIGKPRLIDPKTDLIPLCSNCHSMIHRNRNQPLSLKELKNLLSNNSTLVLGVFSTITYYQFFH